MAAQRLAAEEEAVVAVAALEGSGRLVQVEVVGENVLATLVEGDALAAVTTL